MPKNVIIVDNDYESVDILAKFLEWKDIRVVGMGINGEMAFELYKKIKPDFVVMGVFMWKYDGLYGLKKIRRFDPHSKVIMITSDLSYATKTQLTKLNPTAILKKPREINKIPEIIGRKRLHKNLLKV